MSMKPFSLVLQTISTLLHSAKKPKNTKCLAKWKVQLWTDTSSGERHLNEEKNVTRPIGTEKNESFIFN